MDNIKCFKVLLESIPDYRKMFLIMFLIKNENDFLQECGFLKNDIDRLCKEFKNILIQQNEENYSYVKNEKDSVLEKILNKLMERIL